nr:uncharacterized protein LOC129282046 [Lytechinus pictus]
MDSAKCVLLGLGISLCVFSLVSCIDAKEKAKKIHAPSYASKIDLVQEVDEGHHRWRRDTDDDDDEEDIDAAIAELDRILAEIRATHESAQYMAGQTRASSNQYQVRLQGGSSEYEGRVEIRYQNQWYMVCDDGWGIEEANVVCNQLGYDGAQSAVQLAAIDFGSNSNSFAMDDVVCSGTETELIKCSYRGWGSHNCENVEAAGVRCVERTIPNRAIRSVQGGPASPDSSGIVLRFNINEIPPWLQSILGSKPEASNPGDAPSSGTGGGAGETGTSGTTGLDGGTQVVRARDPECYTMLNGQDYRGVVSQTISGHTCQQWNVQTPHTHSYTPAQYTGILGNHNHCRNPGTFSQPWCYTTDPRIIREYCDVGNPRTSCTAAAQADQGNAEITDHLSLFARIPAAFLAGHNDGTFSVATPELCAQKCIQERTFVCRSFEYNEQSNECFTSSSNSRDADLTLLTTSQINFFERLDIERNDNIYDESYDCSRIPTLINHSFYFSSATPNCYSGNGENYRGFSFTTVQGRQCTNWQAAALDRVGVTPALFPDGGIGNHNFCRNPDSDRRPWCYYKDPDSSTVTGWMYCNITVCSTTTAPPTERPAPQPPVPTQAPSGPVPISRGKPAFQSSTFTSGGVMYHARLAVDGNANPNFDQGSCSRTHHRANSWWYIDLQGTYDVNTVVIVNKDTQGERLRGSMVSIGSSATDPSSRIQCGRITRGMTAEANSDPHKRIRIDCPSSIRGSYVHIGSPRKDYLSLCEVEVYGTPSSPTAAPEPAVTCTASEFECTSGSVSCVAERLQCNGENDCTDGSDESGCRKSLIFKFNMLQSLLTTPAKDLNETCNSLILT